MSPHAEALALVREVLAIRRQSIVPRLAGMESEETRWKLLGSRGITVAWRLADGALLSLAANLGDHRLGSDLSPPPGELLYATPGSPERSVDRPLAPGGRRRTWRMSGASLPPRATYRVQFGPDFRFTDAEALVPYLADLGISHLYASPYLKARPGSTHGYDITDHNEFNPEVGDAGSFDSLAAALARHDMGQILDFVPNHMGIGKSDTPWWLDVLEWGEESPFAHYFDIDWAPAKLELRGKVLVPSLGDHYGKVLQAGELRLAFDAEAGTFSVWYYDNRFPITPIQYGKILAVAHARLKADHAFPEDVLVEFELLLAGFANLARGGRMVRQRAIRRAKADRLKSQLAGLVAANPQLAAAIDGALAEINGRPGDAASFRRLHRILEAQAWRLAYWRVAAEEINYRRFFQINELAGIRIEVPEVFEAAHGLVFRLIGEGKLHGLRIDHIDGLFDPEQYLVRLQRRIADILAATGQNGDDERFYVVVEKILAGHERLRESWPIAGTTGYDFLVRTNALFVDPAAEPELDRCYTEFVGDSAAFEEMVYECKTLAMDQELASELRVLANEFNKLTETNWLTRDYTLVGLRQAMREIVACFPVYRTYVDRGGADAEDRRDLDWAIAHGRRRSLSNDKSVFDFIQGVLITDLGRGRHPQFNRREVQRLAQKFQQYTGPVMAKGVEDTAFYRYNRLVSLNEVGGDPLRCGLSVAACHKINQVQAKAWPQAMLASATHDTKRGEDCRARINLLSEKTEEWAARVQRWATLNARLKATVEDGPAPSANDEYLFYQTMIGAWPLECSGRGRTGSRYRCRLPRPRHRLHDEGGPRGEAPFVVDGTERRLRRRPRQFRRQVTGGRPAQPVPRRFPHLSRLDRAARGRSMASPRRFSNSPCPAFPTSIRAANCGTSASSIPITAAPSTMPCADGLLAEIRETFADGRRRCGSGARPARSLVRTGRSSCSSSGACSRCAGNIRSCSPPAGISSSWPAAAPPITSLPSPAATATKPSSSPSRG